MRVKIINIKIGFGSWYGSRLNRFETDSELVVYELVFGMHSFKIFVMGMELDSISTILFARLHNPSSNFETDMLIQILSKLNSHYHTKLKNEVIKYIKKTNKMCMILKFVYEMAYVVLIHSCNKQWHKYIFFGEK